MEMLDRAEWHGVSFTNLLAGQTTAASHRRLLHRQQHGLQSGPPESTPHTKTQHKTDGPQCDKRPSGDMETGLSIHFLHLF